MSEPRTPNQDQEDISAFLGAFSIISGHELGLFTQAQAAALCGVPKQRIAEAVKDGRLPLKHFRVKVGGQMQDFGPFVSGRDVQRYRTVLRRPRGGPTKEAAAKLRAEIEAAKKVS